MRGSHALLEGTWTVDGYILWLQAANKSLHTQRTYLQWVRSFRRWCTEHELDHLVVTRDHLTYFLGSVARDHAPSTVYLVRSCLRSYFDYLKEGGMVGANPTSEIRWKRPASRPTEPFSEDELRRMFIACRNYREQAIFLLFVGAGLRRGEIFRIKKSDVDFQNGLVTVFGKGSKYRTVCPGPRAMLALERALEFDEYLCPYKYIEYVWMIIKQIGQRAGIRGRIFPHRFRHTMASKWLEMGGSLEELQTILGHSDVRTTIHYVEAYRKQRALNRMVQMDIVGRLLGPGEMAG